jgi:hypothetical protein
MGKLCIIMQHITLYTPCIAFMLVSHTCIIVIGHAEQEPKEAPDPAQVEGVNPEQDKGKPRCIEPPSVSLFYPFIPQL